MLNITDNWKWPFILINWEEIFINEIELEKLQNWCKYQDGEVIETQEYRDNILNNEKQELIIEYKNIKSELKEIKLDIQELDDTYESKDEWGKQFSDIRKLVLEKRLSDIRKKWDNLALEWITKFWQDIISEF